jgi:hypothetical protein
LRRTVGISQEEICISKKILKKVEESLELVEKRLVLISRGFEIEKQREELVEITLRQGDDPSLSRKACNR